MLNGIMPFRIDNLGKLWTTQINKDYKFRTSVIPRTSREAIDLVSSMLEPNWFERITVKEVLNSEWFSLEPSLLQYTPKEEEALQRTKTFHPENNVKLIKKVMRSNRAKKTIEPISKEDIQEPSDDMDEATKILNMPKHLRKTTASELLKQANQEQNSLSRKVTERRGSQEGRRTSFEIRTSFEGRRTSIDVALDASIAERSETSKEMKKGK